MSTGVKFDERAACQGCGRFGAYLFDGEHLCGDCYEQHGSCCPECRRETDDEPPATRRPCPPKPDCRVGR